MTGTPGSPHAPPDPDSHDPLAAGLPADLHGAPQAGLPANAPASGRALRLATATLALAVPAGFGFFFSLLQRRFDYPAIMDRPAAQVLAAADAAGTGAVLLWAGAMAAAVLLVGLVVLLGRVLADTARPAPWYLGVAVACGVLSAAFTSLDLAQWVFLVPGLATTWSDPSATEATRAAAAVTFQAFHAWVGVGIGMYLATFFSGAWTLLTGVAMRRSPLFGPVAGWLGIGAGVVLLASIAQPAGFALWATLNTAGFGLWSIWLLWSGARLLRATHP